MKKFSEYFAEGIVGDLVGPSSYYGTQKRRGSTTLLYMKDGQKPHDEAAANKIVADHKAEFTPMSSKKAGYHHFRVPNKHVDSFVKHMAVQGVRIGGSRKIGGKSSKTDMRTNVGKSKSIIPDTGWNTNKSR